MSWLHIFEIICTIPIINWAQKVTFSQSKTDDLWYKKLCWSCHRQRSIVVFKCICTTENKLRHQCDSNTHCRISLKMVSHFWLWKKWQKEFLIFNTTYIVRLDEVAAVRNFKLSSLHYLDDLVFLWLGPSV